MAQQGYSDVLIGLQFGDEGKARIVDMLAKDYDIIARFNGGSNAGHTIENEKGKVALQQVPSGVFYENKQLYIGSGCVVNVVKLAKEIAMLNGLGVDLSKRLHIAGQASMIQPHHILLDELQGKGVGTTKNGIGPAYADKATRMNGDRLVNIRLADMLQNKEDFAKKMSVNLEETIKTYKIADVDVKQKIAELQAAFDSIKEYIEDDPLFLQRMVEQGNSVLFEGAQSAMLDVTKGSVPYVTSSSTIAAAAYVGGDLSVNYHRKTVGVVKAVMSRVGWGPFPSELGGRKSEEYCMAAENGKPTYGRAVEAKYNIDELLMSNDLFEVGKGMRIISGEYGTVTTRPRRIGVLDLVQLAFICKMNHVDELYITKCDVLQTYSRTKKKKLAVVNGYELNGEKINYVPSSPEACYNVQPTFDYFDAFSEDISEIRTFAKLPKALQDFVGEIEQSSGAKVVGLGVGPQRDQFVFKK